MRFTGQKIFRKAIVTDVAYYFLNSLIPGFLLGAPVALLAWLVHHAIRAHAVDMVFTRLCALVPAYVLGLAAPVRGGASLVPVWVLLLAMVWGFFIHAYLRWSFGPPEWLIATPAFHHWHHTNEGQPCVNKNYAALLPWVDRLFGTLYLPKDKRPAHYGIDQPLPSRFLGQLARPFVTLSGSTA